MVRKFLESEGYDLYAVSFEMVNSNNDGGYYSGMTPGTIKYPRVLAYDSYNLSWGNTADLSLSQAIAHFSSGAFFWPGIICGFLQVCLIAL